jgi:hypothetical protein
MIYSNFDSFFESCCITPTGDYELVCMDSYGDGWNMGYIVIEGMQFCGDMDGSEMVVQIGTTYR